ncbi:hypothetical protein [Streptomyces sp. NPDC003720]|uniref:hypothetical protein n=1 Tax=Streptomyces sp. NPDC003720 TaxID=3364684 RepID=UPI0036AB35AA
MSTGRHRWTRAGLKEEIDRLETALRAEQVKNARADRQHRTDSREITRLQDALQAWQARWSNAFPVSVPAPRDLRPADDRPTVPVDVSQVRAIHRVIPITERPDATNPANIPAA